VSHFQANQGSNSIQQLSTYLLPSSGTFDGTFTVSVDVCDPSTSTDYFILAAKGDTVTHASSRRGLFCFSLLLLAEQNQTKSQETAIKSEEVVTIGTMITGLPETNEAHAETKSEANVMVPIQKLKEKKNGSGKSLGSAEPQKEEVEDGNEIGDDVALTFPQRVSDDKRMLPRGSISLELPMCSNAPQTVLISMFLFNEDSSTRHLTMHYSLNSQKSCFPTCSSWRFSTMKSMPISLPGFPTVAVL
jgi:hypothetical protein